MHDLGVQVSQFPRRIISLYIAPATPDVVDTFTMPDDRMICPHFERRKQK
jgi:hypothetical protein